MRKFSKQSFDEGFVISGIISWSQRLRLILNTCLDVDYSGFHQNRIYWLQLMCCNWRGTQFINLKQELKKVSILVPWLVHLFLLHVISLILCSSIIFSKTLLSNSTLLSTSLSCWRKMSHVYFVPERNGSLGNHALRAQPTLGLFTNLLAN